MMEKDLESLIFTTVWEAQEKALNSETNMKALERKIYEALRSAANALVNVKKFYQRKAEIVEQINQLLPKIETEMDELYSPIQLTIDAAGKLSTMRKISNKKSAINRAAKSNLVGEIATALDELYEKEKPTIIKLLKLPKWEFVAKYMDKSLPQEYQRHESSDAPGAWERLVSRHKPID